MINSLIQYLVKFGHLVLPGIGTLNWQKNEAHWEGEELVAPNELVNFDPIYDKPNKSFYIYLGEDLGLNEDQAKIQFESFLNQFTNQSIANLPIGNIGVIHKNASQYRWENQFIGNTYYSNQLPKLVEGNDTDNSEVEVSHDRQWIIWTLIIIIISISLIFYKQF